MMLATDYKLAFRKCHISGAASLYRECERLQLGLSIGEDVENNKILTLTLAGPNGAYSEVILTRAMAKNEVFSRVGWMIEYVYPRKSSYIDIDIDMSEEVEIVTTRARLAHIIIRAGFSRDKYRAWIGKLENMIKDELGVVGNWSIATGVILRFGDAEIRLCCTDSQSLIYENVCKLARGVSIEAR